MNNAIIPGHSAPPTVVVLGGYGGFGSWVVRGLAEEPALSTVVAGRSLARANAFCSALPASLRRAVRPQAIDANSADLALRLKQLKAGVVVHAAGPFQGQDYRVARACIEAGCHYIDLADGREFVTGIEALNPLAIAAGTSVVSGASSVPGLSSAAVADLARELIDVRDIRICISPGNKAPRGQATIEAILGYTGRPFPVWRGGEWRTTHGWQHLRRVVFPQVGARWFADCNVPDLDLFPARYPSVRSVSFKAGLELVPLHFAMAAMATMVRAGLVHNWAVHATGVARLARWFEGLGTDRGVMQVTVSGRDGAGRGRELTWTLTAGDGHGPRIPAMPALILARRLLGGEPVEPGARPCMAEFDIADFTRAVRGLTIEQSMTQRTFHGPSPHPARL